jgi:hypothetical protein
MMQGSCLVRNMVSNYIHTLQMINVYIYIYIYITDDVVTTFMYVGPSMNLGITAGLII